jgi:hypothetical protein
MKTIACILSYHMPELTSKTVADLVSAGWEIGNDLFIFENQDEHSAFDHAEEVTHFTGSNLRMTGGWNFIADWCAEHDDDRVWFCTNDFEVTYGTPSPGILSDLPASIGWWHPAVEPIKDYCFPWMFGQNPAGLRDVPMTDSICPAITRECMEYLRAWNHGQVFDQLFYRGWGLDYDSCWQIRQMGKRVVIHDAIRVKHEASRTYTAGKAPESMEAFYAEAHGEMSQRLIAKYGPDWHKMIVG